MPLSIIISLVFFITLIFYFYMGIYVLSLNKNSELHRIFFFICMSLSIWAFSFSIANSAPNYDVCFLWRRISALGWCIMYSLIVHFTLILTGKKSILKKKWFLAALYFPCPILLYVFFLNKEMAAKQYNLIETYAGWINISKGTFWDKLFVVYFLSFSIISISLAFSWGRKTKTENEKKQSNLYVISYIAALLVGSFIQTLSNVVFNIFIPQMAPVVIMIPSTAMLICIKTYGLMLPENKKKAAATGEILSEHTRSKLYTYLTLAYVAGGFLNFVTQYLIYRAPLGKVLIYSAIIMLIAPVLLLVQKIKIEVKYKDLISFFIISMSYPAAVFFGYIKTAATTMWSVVFVLALIAVVFNRKDMLIIVGGVALITLTSIWIFVPSKVLILQTTDHIARIIILLVFLWIALFVNRVYVQRLNESENQMRIQQMQTTASAFLDTANEADIADKMKGVLQQCGNYLEAELGYIIIFGSGSKPENTVFEWCEREIESITENIFLLTIQNFTEWADEIVTGKSNGILVKNTNALTEGTPVRQWSINNKVKSMMVMPLANKEKCIGVWGFLTKKKEIHWNTSHLNALKMIGSRVTDIYLNIEAEKELIRMAYYDTLTGLPNSSLFTHYLSSSLQASLDSKYKMGIIFLDLDFFKTVNDFMGYAWGNELLKVVAKRLRTIIRKEDILCRSTGDKFLILITRAEGLEEIESIARRILDSLSNPIEMNEREVSITVSMGISTTPEDGEAADDLIKNAELAMFVSKKSGKNRYTVCTSEIKEESLLENELSNDLYRALEKQEFTVYYQPKINAQTEEIVGMEALIRWNHPEKGLIPPAVFIPLAEKIGLVGDIDQWVFKAACLQNKLWQDKGFAPIRMAVNFSLSQFFQENVIEKAARCLQETALSPEYLEVEITESIANYKSESILKILDGMKALGISIAIDDFGTEYSSLSRLHTLPVDRLKIDRQFVWEFSKGKTGHDILKTIFSLGKALGLKTTAEGVETEEQLSFVRSMGCDEIQGYYYYKPMPCEEIEKILEQRMNR